MSLMELINQEMCDTTLPTTIHLTKQSEEHLIYLRERFQCTTADEIINYLIGYASTTAYTDRIIRELNQ